MNSETRNCQNCHKDFEIDAEDFQFYEKMKVPPPTWCPQCRMQRRMMWHNERYLFRRKSDKSGKEIFSMFPPEAMLTVWDREEWIADDWDQNETGMDYDWSRSFFEQFKELMMKSPIPSRATVQLVNSDYTNNVTNLKDCYLVFGSSNIENGAYLENGARVKDSLDISFVSDSQLSYECFFNARCYNAFYSSYCEDCRDIYFCRDCMGCSDCFGCVGLRGKSYYIFNQPYSKEEYKRRLEEFGVNSNKKREVLKKQVVEFWAKFPVRYARNYKNTNCSGEYITNSKNVRQSYYVDGGENIKYSQGLYVQPSRDSYDQYRYGNNSELIYECAVCGGHSTKIKFSYHVYVNCREVEYSRNCNGSSFLFGCVGLNKKQYCILNKQYREEDYNEMVEKIKKHMNDLPYIDAQGKIYKYGEFLPPIFSPIAYNQSVAMEYFPLEKEDAIRKGYAWQESERRSYSITLPSENIPDVIAEVPSSILSEVIGCKHASTCNHECTNAFRLISQELQFYKRLNIPLPHLCPNCRYFERISERNSIKLISRRCQCAGLKSENAIYTNVASHFHGDTPCPNEFQTNYSPERPEIVYCENCYNSEVV